MRLNSVVIGGWSVGVEAMFYVLLPLLYRITRTLFASVILLTTTATVCGVGSYYLGIYLRDWFEYWTFYWFPVELPVFCMGILVYYLEKSVRQKIRPHFYRRLSIVLIIASVFIFANSLPSSNYRLYWTSMAFVPLTLGLALHEWKLFVNPVTIFIGVRSYSIYLLHIFVMVALVKFFPSVRGSKFGCLVLYLSTTAVTLALSDLTYRFIEKPGTRFGRRCEEWGKADSVTTKR